jgi:hypothetical protein
MALIECPECEGVVSDRALACVHCGFPIVGFDRMPAMASGRRVQTVEQTSKAIKANIILGLATMAGGVAGGSLGMAGGWMLAGAGFAWFAVAAFLQWWKHG